MPQNLATDVDFRIRDLNARNIVGSSYAGLTRAMLAQQAFVAHAIPFTSCRVHDALATNLPAAAAADDMGLNTGTPGTDAPTLRGVDFGGTTSDDKCSFEFVLPPEYDEGQSFTLRIRAAMLTTVSDGTCTVDVECWQAGDDGTVGSDLCATAAQSINSLTPADKDFEITPTGLLVGAKLIVRVSFAGSDTGNAGVMIPAILQMFARLDIKG